MLLSLVSVTLLTILSNFTFRYVVSQQHPEKYVSPYDEDPRAYADNLRFYTTYVQTHPFHHNSAFEHHHHGSFHGPGHEFLHFPGFVNDEMFGGGPTPPPKSPYELCFRQIYMPVVRSSPPLVNFCARYARFINRVPFLPKVPTDIDQEGSGMEDIL